MFGFNNSALEQRILYLEKRFEEIDDQAWVKFQNSGVKGSGVKVSSKFYFSDYSGQTLISYQIHKGENILLTSTNRRDVENFLDGMKAAFTN